MDETKWTRQRKKLCIAFWDDCAQNSCKEPCSRILEAEKEPKILTDNTLDILKTWEVCTCRFCGSSGKSVDFFLFGVEAHKNDPTIEIIKMCMKCKNDWISTYMR